MNKHYKQYVYILLLSMLVSGRAQTIQDISRMKSEYEQAQALQYRLGGSSNQEVTLDPMTGMPRQISLIPYKSKLIDDEIGYLRLRAFNENSSDQLKDEIYKLEKNKKLLKTKICCIKIE